MIRLMTHLVIGYPTREASESIAQTLLQAGVSYLEIQIPFSDPVADGPTIQQANRTALKNGITPEDAFSLMKRLSATSRTPLLFMTYYNIPFRYGLERFIRRTKASGGYGLIIPDLPIDEEARDHYLKLCRQYGLHAIQIVSPLTPFARLEKIAAAASGFVYAVSRFGVTGEKGDTSATLSYLKKIKRAFRIPIAVGFGIQDAAQAKALGKQADIVVIGSKLIRLYDETPEGHKEDALRDFLGRILS